MRACSRSWVVAALCLLGAGCGSNPPPVTDGGTDLGPADVTCPSGQARCGAQCVDLQADPAHCGACDTACPAGQACGAGACTIACPTGQAACSGTCATLMTDRAHCGACDHACPAGQVCSLGACALECGPGLATCGGLDDGGSGARFCADTQNNPAHCGACGQACPAGQGCVAGRCALRCPTGQVACGEACATLASDPVNCGTCGVACTPGEVCAHGSCTLACGGGLSDCSGSCRDLQADRANCGMCGQACPGLQVCQAGRCTLLCGMGQVDCGGVCVSTATDNAHCGMCGQACTGGTRCEGGRCVSSCAPGQSFCAGACRDTLTDGAHCGSCDHACPAGQVCSAGDCRSAVCTAPQVDCAGVCRDLASDRAHCGSCGHACADPAHATGFCAAGTCRFGCNAGYADCNASGPDGCEANVAGDPVNCGRCGNTCPAGTNARPGCDLGACALLCNTGFDDCDGMVGNGCETDLRSSNANCGACGNVCPAPPHATAACTGMMCGMTCTTGWGDCNHDAGDGCEANLQTDAANCGTCGTACASGRPCTAGACVVNRYAPGTVPPGVTFVDACSQPGHGVFLSSLDDSTTLTSLPFAFHYWNQDLAAGASITLSSNGYLLMNSSNQNYLGGTIPSADAINGVVAVHWGDNYTNSPGLCTATVGTAPNRQYVVEWYASRYYGGGGSFTFEAVLYEGTNIIDFLYSTMSGTRAQVAGLESPDGAQGVPACGSYSCTPATGTRYRFVPAP